MTYRSTVDHRGQTLKNLVKLGHKSQLVSTLDVHRFDGVYEQLQLINHLKWSLQYRKLISLNALWSLNLHGRLLKGKSILGCSQGESIHFCYLSVVFRVIQEDGWLELNLIWVVVGRIAFSWHHSLGVKRGGILLVDDRHRLSLKRRPKQVSTHNWLSVKLGCLSDRWLLSAR